MHVIGLVYDILLLLVIVGGCCVAAWHTYKRHTGKIRLGGLLANFVVFLIGIILVRLLAAYTVGIVLGLFIGQPVAIEFAFLIASLTALVVATAIMFCLHKVTRFTIRMCIA